MVHEKSHSFFLYKRRVTVRTAENIHAAQEALEVNNGCLSARRRNIGISASSICQITLASL